MDACEGYDTRLAKFGVSWPSSSLTWCKRAFLAGGGRLGEEADSGWLALGGETGEWISSSSWGRFRDSDDLAAQNSALVKTLVSCGRN